MKLLCGLILSFIVAASALNWAPYAFQPATVIIPSNGTLVSWQAAPFSNVETEQGKTWKIDATQCNAPGLTINPISGMVQQYLPTNWITFTIDPAAYNRSMLGQIIDCKILAFLEKDTTVNATYLLQITISSNWCDYYSSNPCVEGTCNNVTHKCECKQDFYGPICNSFCTASSTCSSHGSCDKNNGSCICNDNWYGQNCDAYCVANTTCRGFGTCNSYSGECNCNKDRYGDHCEHECPCYIGGYCDFGGQCHCHNNYYGANCTIKCEYKTTCNNNGFCDSNGSCRCFGLRFGSNCQYSGTLILIIAGAVLGLIMVGLMAWRVVKHKRSGYSSLQ